MLKNGKGMNMAKKTRISAGVMLFFLFSAMTLENLPNSYYGWMKQTGGLNYLPAAADMLKKNHGISVYIHADREENSSVNRAAEYYERLAPDGRHIAIWFSSTQKEGKIFTDQVTAEKTGRKYIQRIEKDVLEGLISRWYTADDDVLAKVLGSFVYMLEKDVLTKEELKKNHAFIIPIDNFFYSLSFLPVISEAVRMFYFEPITFFIFFPFAAYFIIVRVIGSVSGIVFFRFMNAVWFVLVAAVFLSIIAKLKTLYPVYYGMFLLFSGFSIPLYAYLYGVYRDKIETAARNYFMEMKGGFDSENAFEAEKW